MNPRRFETIFLDYDGTLHDTLRIYAPAFRKAYAYLVKTHGAPEHEWSDKEISQFLGQTPSEMWDQFGGDLSDEAKADASRRISEDMERRIRSGEPRLFPGTLDVLAELKRRGHALVFISNCKNYYLKAHAELFGLDEYFDRMVCSETYTDIEQKHDVLGRVMQDFDAPMVIVGDRHHDIEAGRHHGIHTIGAAYGFGSQSELAAADETIDDIHELLERV